MTVASHRFVRTTQTDADTVAAVIFAQFDLSQQACLCKDEWRGVVGSDADQRLLE